MDCEFVLGSLKLSPPERILPDTLLNSGPRNILETRTFHMREVHLWIIDFDKARPFRLNKRDIDTKLVPAFLGNDPYFPRHDVDQPLWDLFSSAYLRASATILACRGAGDPHRLPAHFLRKVEDFVDVQRFWIPEDQVIFA